MIGYLKGAPLSLHEGVLTVLCKNGVGYDVHLHARMWQNLESVPSEVSIYTHLQVKEDMHQLFGFQTLQERSFFRLLLKVSGVGPKLALTVLALDELEHTMRAIYEGDAVFLSKAKGLSKKGAEKVILEIKDKVDHQKATQESQSLPAKTSSLDEAKMALLALGYRPQEIKSKLEKLPRSLHDATTSEMVHFLLSH